MNAPTTRMTPLVPAGWARIGPICSIPAVLAELGFDATKLLLEIGFPLSLFDDPERIMDYREGGRLLAACAARTGCAHFGLLVGRRCSVAGLGLVGSLARAETNVGSALQTIVRYLPLFDRGSTLTLRVDGEDASLIFGILTAGMRGADQLYDLAIAIAFNTLRDLCGSCWRPVQVTLPHRAPADLRPFETITAPRCASTKRKPRSSSTVSCWGGPSPPRPRPNG
jgi:Arabinose-binding domain of AraC transcription regulator, N-term